MTRKTLTTIFMTGAFALTLAPIASAAPPVCDDPPCDGGTNHNPTISIAATPASPVRGQSVNLTATVADIDGDDLLVAWDLDNDGQYDDETGDDISTSFSTLGAKTIKARVSDPSGGTGSATKSITVINRDPVSSFTVSPAQPKINQTVTFTSTSTDPDGDGVGPVWDLDNDGSFDDGSTGQVTKSWTLPGTYIVRLMVGDGVGGSAVSEQTVTVKTAFPIAKISGPANAVVGQEVTFDSSGSTDDVGVTGRAWDTNGDGFFTDGTGVTAKATYATPGVKTVQLRVSDAEGQTSDTVTKQVTVTAAPAGPDPDPGNGGNGGSGSTGSSGNGASNGANGGPSAQGSAQVRIAAKASGKFKTKKGKTQVKKLTLTGLPSGSTVKVSYKGKTTTSAATSATLALAKQFKNKKLKAGTVITIVVSKPGMAPQTLSVTTQKAGKPVIAIG